MRYTTSGLAVTNFTLAVDRRTNKQGDKETDFIDIITWQKLAEICANHLTKGRQVAVRGRLEIQPYETKDGQKRKAARVIADEVQFLGPKSANDNSQSDEMDIGDEVDLSGEDLPF